ncbi:MBL fold metallo-hydrolase [Actinokineospora cianjurensis]|uniref:Glyoxylase-like metal-dependent hydrolase (Beta-lactamase superfamily II) n=1 Tax=Actinokineospora cianjurensis TaxID=585224 RepID=A0A421AZ92_9PSEU|nr:MBL fold metallo-hydrolase [Actinokineospora cianjurensis]RLK55148.1 glyoxylase-like metal-dependent hydrolase (beta-lactamase superfamily II) [Actinokineospora cianjurensis]
MRWIELADRVFACRYTELDQTLGLVVGDTGCLVIDTGTDETHGAQWAAAVREVTDLPWTVVITHAHWDHFLGTTAFPGADVWAHPRCTAEIVDGAGAQAESWAARYRESGRDDLAERLLAARVVLPTHAVADRVDLDLGDRVVTLRHPGHGHTDNDIVVHVPDEGVLFAGDTVEQGAPPSIGKDGYPLRWPSALDALLDLGPRIIVPGHGEPVDPGFVRGQRAELAVIASLFDGVRSGTLTVDEAVAQSPYPEEATRPALERGRVA